MEAPHFVNSRRVFEQSKDCKILHVQNWQLSAFLTLFKIFCFLYVAPRLLLAVCVYFWIIETKWLTPIRVRALVSKQNCAIKANKHLMFCFHSFCLPMFLTPDRLSLFVWLFPVSAPLHCVPIFMDHRCNKWSLRWAVCQRYGQGWRGCCFFRSRPVPWFDELDHDKVAMLLFCQSSAKTEWECTSTSSVHANINTTCSVKNKDLCSYIIDFPSWFKWNPRLLIQVMSSNPAY